MSGRPAHRAVRLAIVALVAVTATLGATIRSPAAPSRQEVEQARARLDALNRELSLLVERYNQARIRLDAVQARLAEVRARAERAQAAANHAIASLNSNAARAYQRVGSQFAMLFDSDSLADFTDRLEFIDSMAQSDADLALAAELTRQEARWTAEELAATVTERQAVLQEIGAERAQIVSRIAEARSLYETLDRRFHEALAAQRAAARATAGSVPPSSDTSPIPPPPAPNANVATVLQAAYSAIGTPYQYAGSSPETGFDCSGFTMWAWSHVGVSLPHSSAMQYAALPHVAREDLQPGDLLFFYTPISHVGMYVGGGQMIHSSHPGTTVGVVAVYWDSFVGAARPG
jgi:cell wall-associated NlpC family hydrolase